MSSTDSLKTISKSFSLYNMSYWQSW